MGGIQDGGGKIISSVVEDNIRSCCTSQRSFFRPANGRNNLPGTLYLCQLNGIVTNCPCTPGNQNIFVCHASIHCNCMICRQGGDAETRSDCKICIWRQWYSLLGWQHHIFCGCPKGTHPGGVPHPDPFPNTCRRNIQPDLIDQTGAIAMGYDSWKGHRHASRTCTRFDVRWVHSRPGYLHPNFPRACNWSRKLSNDQNISRWTGTIIKGCLHGSSMI